MITRAQIHDFLFNWLRQESGYLTVIDANQKKARPARPYVSMNFQNASASIGGDDQWSETIGTYPNAAGLKRVKLNAAGAGDSITIDAHTSTYTDPNLNVKTSIDAFIKAFRVFYPTAVITRIASDTFDFQYANGSAVGITSVGNWTIAASPNVGKARVSIAAEGMRKAVCSINVFGPDAIDLASKIRDSLGRPDIVESFIVAGLAHLDDSDIEDLTELQETEYEERGQFDLTVSFIGGSEIDVSAIEKVNVAGSASGSQPDHETTLTVP